METITNMLLNAACFAHREGQDKLAKEIIDLAASCATRLNSHNSHNSHNSLMGSSPAIPLGAARKVASVQIIFDFESPPLMLHLSSVD